MKPDWTLYPTLVFCILWVVFRVADAQPPSIESAASAPPMAAEMTYTEHSKIVLEADPGNVSEGTSVLVSWNVVSQDVSYEHPDKDRRTLYLWAPPGQYAVFANIYTDPPDAPASVTTTKIWITIVPRGPPPEPEPDPTDPPPGNRLVAIVYESSTTPVPIQVHEARKTLESQGHRVRVIDPDVTTGTGTVPKELAASITAAREAGLPSLVVSSADGRVIRAIRLPDTAEAIVREATTK